MALPMAPTTPTTPSQSSKQLRLRGRLLTLRRRRLLCPSTTPSTTATTATHSPTTTERGRPSPLLMPMLMPRLTLGLHTVAMLVTLTPMATFLTTPTPWSPRRLLSHSPFPMAGSTTTAMATLAIPLSSLLLARPLSPPSTTMARGLLMPSLLLMLMLRLTLGWHTDMAAMATDSTGHTDTAPTMEDILDMDMEDTELTDIPTTDKDIAARFLFEYLP